MELTIEGRHIGELTPSGVWRKTIHRDRHMLRRMGEAICFDALTVDRLASRGELRALAVREVVENVVYAASVETFMRYKEEVNYGEHGRQYALRLRYWSPGWGPRDDYHPPEQAGEEPWAGADRLGPTLTAGDRLAPGVPSVPPRGREMERRTEAPAEFVPPTRPEEAVPPPPPPVLSRATEAETREAVQLSMFD